MSGDRIDGKPTAPTAPTDARSEAMDSADVMRRYEQARYIKSREARIKHERTEK